MTNHEDHTTTEDLSSSEDEESRQKESKLAKMKRFLRKVPRTLSKAGQKLPTPIKKALPVSAATASGIVAPPLLAPVVGGFLYQLIKTHAPTNIQINEEALLEQAEQVVIKKGQEFIIDQLLGIFDDTAAKHDIETLQITLQKALKDYHAHLLEAISHLQQQPNDVQASLEFIAEEIADLQEAQQLNHLLMTRLDDIYARIQRGFERMYHSLEELNILLNHLFIQITEHLMTKPLTKERLLTLSSLQLHSVPMSSGNDWTYLEDLYVPRETEEDLFSLWQKSLNPRFDQNLFLVIGEAGMGKTWFLARQARQTAEHDPVFFIPVRIGTRTLGFKNYLETEVFHKPFYQVIADIHQLRKNEDPYLTAYFFVDGLDEVKSSERQSILRDILSLHRQQGIAIILSCRYHDWMNDPQIKMLKNRLEDMVYLNEQLLAFRKQSFKPCAPAKTSACLAEFTDQQLTRAMLRHDLPEIPQELWNLAKKPFVFRLLVLWYHQQGHLPNPQDPSTMLTFITGTTNSIFDRMGIIGRYREQVFHLIETLIQTEDPRPYLSDLMTLDAQIREFLLSCGIFHSKESMEGVIIYLNPDMESYLLLGTLLRRKKRQKLFQDLLIKTVKIFPQHRTFLERGLHVTIKDPSSPDTVPLTSSQEQTETRTHDQQFSFSGTSPSPPSPAPPTPSTSESTPRTTPSSSLPARPPTAAPRVTPVPPSVIEKIIQSIQRRIRIKKSKPPHQIRFSYIASKFFQEPPHVVYQWLQQLLREGILIGTLETQGTDNINDDLLVLPEHWNSRQEVQRLIDDITTLEANREYQQVIDKIIRLRELDDEQGLFDPKERQLWAERLEKAEQALEVTIECLEQLEQQVASLTQQQDEPHNNTLVQLLEDFLAEHQHQLPLSEIRKIEQRLQEVKSEAALQRQETLLNQARQAIQSLDLDQARQLLDTLSSSPLNESIATSTRELHHQLQKFLHPIDYHGTTIMAAEAKALQELERLLGTPIPVLDEVKYNSFGMTVDHTTHHVIALALYKKKIGTIPEFIGNLRHLTFLSLPYNELKSLPETFGQLSRLEYLHLGGNELKSLPETFGQLSRLEYLHLGGNELKSLPETFGQLSRLQELYLYRNHLQSLPETFGNLSNLVELHLDKNQLKSLPETFGQLSRLQILDLGGNELKSLPETFGQLSRLQELYLYRNQLKSLPETLTRITSLKTLWLHDNPSLTLSSTLQQWIERLRSSGCDVRL